jgi:hypothetical protein
MVIMSSEEAIEILKGWQKDRTVLHSRFSDPNTGNDRELCVMFSSVTTSELWVVGSQEVCTVWRAFTYRFSRAY